MAHHYREDEGFDPFAGFQMVDSALEGTRFEPIYRDPMRTVKYQLKIEEVLARMQASLDAQNK